MPVRRYQSLAQPEGVTAAVVAASAAAPGLNRLTIRRGRARRRADDLPLPQAAAAPATPGSGWETQPRPAFRVPSPRRRDDHAEVWPVVPPTPSSAAPGRNRLTLRRARVPGRPDPDVAAFAPPAAAPAAAPTLGWDGERPRRATRQKTRRRDPETFAPPLLAYGWGDGDVSWRGRAVYTPEQDSLPPFPYPTVAQVLRLGWAAEGPAFKRHRWRRPADDFPLRILPPAPSVEYGWWAEAPAFKRSRVYRARNDDVSRPVPVVAVLGWWAESWTTRRVKARFGLPADLTFPVVAPAAPFGWWAENPAFKRARFLRPQEVHPWRFFAVPPQEPQGWWAEGPSEAWVRWLRRTVRQARPDNLIGLVVVDFGQPSPPTVTFTGQAADVFALTGRGVVVVDMTGRPDEFNTTGRP